MSPCHSREGHRCDVTVTVPKKKKREAKHLNWDVIWDRKFPSARWHTERHLIKTVTVFPKMSPFWSWVHRLGTYHYLKKEAVVRGSECTSAVCTALFFPGQVEEKGVLKVMWWNMKEAAERETNIQWTVKLKLKLEAETGCIQMPMTPDHPQSNGAGPATYIAFSLQVSPQTHTWITHFSHWS